MEHLFFGALTLLVIAAVFIGFARTYFLAGLFTAKLPSLLVHVHAALFTSWVVLFTVQVLLISRGRTRWHMRLGIMALVVAPLMVIFGFATLAAAVRRHFAPPDELHIIVAADSLTLSIFAGLVMGAFLTRREPATHKRLMMLATCVILAPAISRWPYQFMDSDLAFFGVLDSFVVFLAAYDLWSRRSLHRATLWGILLTAGWQLAYRPLAHSAFLHGLVVWLQHA